MGAICVIHRIARRFKPGPTFKNNMSDMQRHLELEHLGILRQTKVPRELEWMTENEKSLVLELYLAGEGGVHKTQIAQVEKKAPDTVFNITVRDLAEWLTDKAGRPIALVLAWKGEEIAKLLYQIAKNESKASTRPRVANRLKQ